MVTVMSPLKTEITKIARGTQNTSSDQREKKFKFFRSSHIK